MARRLAILWLVAIVGIALLAPWLSLNPPDQSLFEPLQPPGDGLLLGADALGRDFLARMMYGARLSLLLTGLAVVVTLVFGGLAGFSAAIVGGRYETAVNWLSNVLLAIPGLLLAMLFVAAWGPGIAAVFLAVGIGFAPSFGRVTRTIVKKLLGEGYVMAAQASGGNRVWITSRHLLPNSMPQLASYAGTYVAWAFLAVTTLTFLGLAGDPSIPEWGALLDSSRSHLQTAPRLAAAPALAITLTVLSVHAIARKETFGA
jgi:ABC-type dipeptide/oligopeptide/nickel transport system permease subunit